MNSPAKFVRSIVCVLLVSVASATAVDAQELSAKDRVINLLSAYESTFNQADFMSAAPNAEALLVEILEDDSAWLFVRARALSALTLFANDTNLRRTIAMLTHDNPLLRQYATMHLARTYGKTHPQAVLAPLAKALSDDDIMVRRYAIRAVGGLRMPGAREALASRLRQSHVRRDPLDPKATRPSDDSLAPVALGAPAHPPQRSPNPRRSSM